MIDPIAQLVKSAPGRAVARRAGLPEPASLRRYEPGQPLLTGPAVLGGEGRLRAAAERVILGAGAITRRTPPEAGVPAAALVFDATGIRTVRGLRALYEFFAPAIRHVAPSGRAIVLGTPPEAGDGGEEITAQRAVEGFVRSLAKELRHGATANLVTVAPGAEANVASTLLFLLSARSAYVNGQVVAVGEGESVEPDDRQRPLAGRTALVTGAARGIGAATAATLSRDGATVVCLDVPAQGEALAAVANANGATALSLDITAADAPRRLAEHLRTRHGGVDAVVHNAGVTRDRTLARMTGAEWDLVLGVNLAAPQRLNDVLVGEDLLRPGGRIVCVSSVSGIAGNRGQANYAASKAGLIGMVMALAPALRPSRTINAVAPGFIETEMTASMPLLAREAARRMNSLAQGGRPADVAETIAWLAGPASGGVNGNVVRVCGQSLIGA